MFIRPHTALWILRRLAARCIRIHTRQRGKSEAIAAFDPTLPVYASTYVGYYDDLRQRAKRRMKERREGKTSIVELVEVVRIWTPLLSRDIEEVRRGEFGANLSVPDDMFRDTRELLKYAVEHKDREGNPLHYVDALVAEITPALERAEAEWAEAEEAQEGYSELREKLIEAGVALENDLVTYRQTLQAVLGPNHHDCQKLRIDRVRTPDEDDDEVAAALPESLEETEGAATDTTPPINTQPAPEAPASP